MTRLRIIGTGDFHGALEARPDASGRMRGGAGAFGATVNRAPELVHGKPVTVRPAWPL